MMDPVDPIKGTDRHPPSFERGEKGVGRDSHSEEDDNLADEYD